MNFYVGYTVSLDDLAQDYDTVEERYQKVKWAVQKFTAFQFGVCTFHWDEQAKKYMARPFAFYIFPKSKITD